MEVKYYGGRERRNTSRTIAILVSGVLTSKPDIAVNWTIMVGGFGDSALKCLAMVIIMSKFECNAYSIFAAELPAVLVIYVSNCNMVSGTTVSCSALSPQ